MCFSTFASKFLDKFTDEQLTCYDSLINKPTNDWEIYYWAIGENFLSKHHYVVKPVLSSHSKIDKTKVFKSHVVSLYRSKVLQNAPQGNRKPNFGLLLSGRLRQVLLYIFFYVDVHVVYNTPHCATTVGMH